MKQKNVKISSNTLFVYQSTNRPKGKAAKETDITTNTTNTTTTSLTC
ncbi:MAG: hypothetical protein V4663_16710 [Bacteroidota bacterium]